MKMVKKHKFSLKNFENTNVICKYFSKTRIEKKLQQSKFTEVFAYKT